MGLYKMNFAITYPGELGNQLILLYNIYSLYEEVNHIYAPRFDKYRSYFNIDDGGVLCDSFFYECNKDSFKEINWGVSAGSSVNPDFYDPKFNGLKLKKQFEDEITRIVHSLGNDPLVAIHVRHGDYKWWLEGKHFFSFNSYVDMACQKVKDWGLLTYKLLFFSNVVQPQPPEGILVRGLTGGIAPIDLYLMSQCNYFICPWSTFSLLAVAFSKCLSKFRDGHLIQRS